MILSVDTRNRREDLGDFYGIFFEDLNHAADGGLYGELVQNRDFEFDVIDNPTYNHLTGWERIGDEQSVRLCVMTGEGVSRHNPHYLALDVHRAGHVGVRNLGYGEGMWLESGASYDFTCYAKREQDLAEPLTVSLCSHDGTVLASADFTVSMTWQKYELTLTIPQLADAGEEGCTLALTVSGRGRVYLDFVSLFPQNTYYNRRNGLRKDLAKLLEQLHPRFVRFPGGCLVHDGALDPNARDAQYRWKNTIGPMEERPARRSNWGYHQTLGLGFYEYFQLCEDIGAKPLPVISPGYDPHHHREVPLDHMQYFIDEALDLIEFANGAPDSQWGSVRAKMGHPAPFHMEYLGIGNEEVGEAFFERFAPVYQAVRAAYPDIHIIGTAGPFPAGGEYERGWCHAREDGVDYVDEHYYVSPEWMLANHHRYDNFRADEPKVFLGEYASWGNTWWNALCEASYMTGLERNRHAVGLACYAPLFCNVNYINWQPDMIWFDSRRSYGTANYYVQQLFMCNQGQYSLECTLNDAGSPIVMEQHPDRICGALALSADDAQVTYRDITLTNHDTGEVTTFSDTDLNCTGEHRGTLMELVSIDADSYTLSCKVTELSGFKGFLLYFGKENENNQYCWTIGGWQNQDVCMVQTINGRNSELAQYLFSVERGHEYELRLEVRGRRITTYIDGRQIQDVDVKPIVAEPLYVTAAADENGDIILKAVNVTNKNVPTALDLPALHGVHDVIVQTMCGWNLDDVNSFEEPEKIKPVTTQLTLDFDHAEYTFAAYSITFLRIKKR